MPPVRVRNGSAQADVGNDNRSSAYGQELNWSDLQRGDRVYHFDYGIGTIDCAGPLWLLITWDDPNEYLDHHSSGMARHMTRL